MAGFKEAGINPDAPIDRRPDPPTRTRDVWETAVLVQFGDLLAGVTLDHPPVVSQAKAELAWLGITVQVGGPRGPTPSPEEITLQIKLTKVELSRLRHLLRAAERQEQQRELLDSNATQEGKETHA